jgi:hypothetical protein
LVDERSRTARPASPMAAGAHDRRRPPRCSSPNLLAEAPAPSKTYEVRVTGLCLSSARYWTLLVNYRPLAGHYPSPVLAYGF